MDTPAKILIVDDLPDNAILLKKMLRAEGHQTHILDNGPEALEYLQHTPCDLLLLDVMMPGMSGLEVTRRLKADDSLQYLPILLVTAKTDLASVVEGLDAGADDYLAKPVERQELLARVRSALRVGALQHRLLEAMGDLHDKNKALEEAYQTLLERTREKAQLQTEVSHLRARLTEGHRLQSMIGRSQAMQTVFEQIRVVATSGATVLVRGETGTGKELVARALHAESPRAAGPFIALNCGAVPEGLLESELFGHEKGAFTGALSQKAGRFERAKGGTLFLDEIGDVPIAMQVRLLRVLQEKEFERVGGDRAIKADVRIVAATHKDLEALVTQGDFRQDLYYRLNVIPIMLPPLRERMEDIHELAAHLLAKAAQTHGMGVPELTPEALSRLLGYPWPGNVRELENVLERAVVLSGGRPLTQLQMPGDPIAGPSLPSSVTLGQTQSSASPDFSLPFKAWKQKLLLQHERAYIIAALKRNGGSMVAAGKETGVDAKTFSRKIKEYQIARAEFMTSDT